MNALCCTFMDADLHVKLVNEPENLSGKVHSVYDSVVNIRTCQGELFTLSLDKGYYIPGAFQIRETLRFSLLEDLQGREVSVTKELLEVKGVFRVALGKAQVLYPSFRMASLRPDLSSAYTWAREHLLQMGSGGGCLAFYGSPDRADLLEKELASRIGHLRESPDFGRLLGLGRGLTPSGDDFCLGYLCMSRHFRHPVTHRWRQALRETLLAGAMDTTDVSREMLLHGVKERYIEPLSEFCEGILGGADLPECRKSMEKLLNIGSTSGTDMATGALFALEMLLETENTGGNYGQ